MPIKMEELVFILTSFSLSNSTNYISDIHCNFISEKARKYLANILKKLKDVRRKNQEINQHNFTRIVQDNFWPRQILQDNHYLANSSKIAITLQGLARWAFDFQDPAKFL